MGTLIHCGTAPGPHHVARIARVARSRRRPPAPIFARRGARGQLV